MFGKIKFIYKCLVPAAVLGKNIWGPGPSSFGTQQRLSEITIEPVKNLGAWVRSVGLCPPPGPSLKLPLFSCI